MRFFNGQKCCVERIFDSSKKWRWVIRKCVKNEYKRVRWPLDYEGLWRGSRTFLVNRLFLNVIFTRNQKTAFESVIKETADKWKRINRKQSARWQHLSQLKPSAFFSLQKHLVSCMKRNSLYSGLVTPSSG
jgi:hypothetical protein